MAATESIDEKALGNGMARTPTRTEDGECESVQIAQIDPVEERKLLAKLDLAFIPVIMLVYLSCFLDRSNIGRS